MSLKNRVVEVKRMRIGDIEDHPLNWRTHPDRQQELMAGILNEIGIADTVTAYFSERLGGKLCFIDGHLRKKIDPDEHWDVTILDLSDAEADKLILAHDYITGEAGTDPEKLEELVESISHFDDYRFREIVLDQEKEVRRIFDELAKREEEVDSSDGTPEMELYPFEHYDYVVLVCRDTFTWNRLLDVAGLDARKAGYSPRIGLARAIDADKFLDRVEGVKSVTQVNFDANADELWDRANENEDSNSE